MKIEDYFDKIYCINLKNRKDRWEESQLEFENKGITSVNRFNAISAIPKDLERYGTFNLSTKEVNYKKKIAGTIGCLQSHLKVIKMAKKLKYKSILILEDDVHFCEDAQKKFSKAIDQIPPKWCLLYFGGNEKGKPMQVNQEIYQVSHMLMSHAVAIHFEIYDELIRLLEVCSKPVDEYYAMIQKKHPCYVIYPYLAWQRASWSDIEQRFRIYDFLYCPEGYEDTYFKLQ